MRIGSLFLLLLGACSYTTARDSQFTWELVDLEDTGLGLVEDFGEEFLAAGYDPRIWKVRYRIKNAGPPVWTSGICGKPSLRGRHVEDGQWVEPEIIAGCGFGISSIYIGTHEEIEVVTYVFDEVPTQFGFSFERAWPGGIHLGGIKETWSKPLVASTYRPGH